MNIHIESLDVRCSGKTVLSLSSADFMRGTITAVVGPNGAGKTSLLHAIAHCSGIFAGTILYDGSAFSRSIFRQMTLASNPAYMLSGSVKENIMYPLKLRSVSRAQTKHVADQLIDSFMLSELSLQSAKKLSAGEMQKVNLARALACSPQILLLDEPTSQIDPSCVLDIEKLLCKHALSLDATVLWVTHNLSQAERVASNILFLEKGAARFYGSTADFFCNIENYYNIDSIKKDEFI